MKERVLNNLKKLRDPKFKSDKYTDYLEEAIDYIEESEEPTIRRIEIEWLQKRILDDIYKGKCDSLVFTKLSKYISEYENGNAKTV